MGGDSLMQKPTNELRDLSPPDWPRPRGYSNGLVGSGQIVFIAGQIGWDASQQFHTDDFAGQTRQALQNILAVLAEAGGEPQHIMRLVWYLLDKQEYLACLKEVGEVYREVMGKHYPVMSVVQVSGLIEDRARVEIEATAVIPPPNMEIHNGLSTER
jgi:enamine deaminase RidA (YjgF/YER057c/UK114 family)